MDQGARLPTPPHQLLALDGAQRDQSPLHLLPVGAGGRLAPTLQDAVTALHVPVLLAASRPVPAHLHPQPDQPQGQVRRGVIP